MSDMKEKWEKDHPGQPFIGSLASSASSLISSQMEKFQAIADKVDPSGELKKMVASKSVFQ